VWHALTVATRKAWPVILFIVRGAIANIRIAIAVVKVVVGIVRAAWNAIAAVTRAVWKVVAFVVRHQVAAIRTAVKILDKVRDAIRAVWNKVKDITSAIWGGIKSVVGGVIRWILDQIKAMLGPLQKAYNTVKGWLGGGDSSRRGGKGFNPRGHAEGAYIPATTGGYPAMLAEGGEGEWVVPASKAKSFAKAIGGMGGRGDVFNVYVSDLHGTDRRAAERLANEVTELVAAKLAQRRRMATATGY
jgi:hypothetical protein